MVQNPPSLPLVSCSIAVAWLPGQALLGVGDGVDGWCRDEPCRASLARGLVGEFRDDACRR